MFAYCISLVTDSPLAAFAVVAGYQIIMFIVSSYKMTDCQVLAYSLIFNCSFMLLDTS